MPGNTVSIYIEESCIRVMSTRGKRIARLADMTLEENLSVIDTPEKEAALAGKLRDLLKFNKIREKKIILGLSGLHCLTRPVVLPELPKAMVGEAVAREAKRILPMPLEQLYLSWQITSVSGGKTRLFMTAIPRQIADTAMRIVNKAGYKPYLMDIKPIALARLAKQKTAIILDVQPSEFDIIILVNGIPQPVRTIAFPREALSLPAKIDIVKEDLKRTLDFVKSKTEETGQLTPDTVFLVSGELAEHPELYEPIASEIGYKADKLLSPLKYLKYLEPSQFLVNCGLALKVLIKEGSPLVPNFNSLPAPYLPRHISPSKLLAVPAAVGAVAVLLLLGLSIRNAASDISTIEEQIKNTNFMIAKKQAQRGETIEQIDTLKQQLQTVTDEYNVYAAALRQLAQTGDSLNTNLRTTVDNVQDAVILELMSINASNIAINGSAASEEEVFKYVRVLTDSGRYKEITISSISLTNTDDPDDPAVDFILSCMLKGDQQ